MSHIPTIMVAPAMPTGTPTRIIDSLLETAKACSEAGATAFRIPFDVEEPDVGLAREIMTALVCAHHNSLCFQIAPTVSRFQTLEALNTFLKELDPPAIALPIRDMLALDGGSKSHVQYLYDWADDAHIGIQHVIHSPEDIHVLQDIANPKHNNNFLFALKAQTNTSPALALLPFIRALDRSDFTQHSWMTGMFGKAETSTLAASALLGGHCQTGFIYNTLHTDGTQAHSDAERVLDVQFCVLCLGLTPSTQTQPTILGCVN